MFITMFASSWTIVISLDHAVRQTYIIPETPPVIPSHHVAAALHPHTGMNDKYMMYNLRTVLLHFLMNASRKEVFTAAKYTRPAAQTKIPNIHTKNGVARTFKEKCQAFFSTLFLASSPHPSVLPNTA